MSLQGKLVEIVGLKDALAPTRRMHDVNPTVEALDVNGCKGWAHEWLQEEQRYQVETFDGDYVGIPDENLREYIPPEPEVGGFDVAWPAMGLEWYFDVLGETIVQALMLRNFCTVQMTNVKELAQTATKEAFNKNWSRIMPEFERDFLGDGALGKISWLPQDTSMEAESLAQADGVLTSLMSMLAPYSGNLGFVSGTRSAGLLRMPFEDADEADVCSKRTAKCLGARSKDARNS
jgi:hypothetical protein